MGFRLRKSIKLFGGIKLNLSKSGVGISGGVKGARVSIGPRGTRTTLSVPGTGMSYVSEKGLKKRPGKQTSKQQVPMTKAHTARPYKGIRWLVGSIIGLMMAGTNPGLGILVSIVCGVRYYFVRQRLKQQPSDSKPIMDTKARVISLPTTTNTTTLNTNVQVKNKKAIRTKVAGVTFGEGQNFLEECGSGQHITIVNKPMEKFPHAMVVYACVENFKLKKLGYLNNELAQEVFERYWHGDGDEIDGVILEVTGGTSGSPTMGCNIEFYVDFNPSRILVNQPPSTVSQHSFPADNIDYQIEDEAFIIDFVNFRDGKTIKKAEVRFSTDDKYFLLNGEKERFNAYRVINEGLSSDQLYYRISTVDFTFWIHPKT